MSLIKLANDVEEYYDYMDDDADEMYDPREFSHTRFDHRIEDTNFNTVRDQDGVHAVNIVPKGMEGKYSLFGERSEENPEGRLEIWKHYGAETTPENWKRDLIGKLMKGPFIGGLGGYQVNEFAKRRGLKGLKGGKAFGIGSGLGLGVAALTSKTPIPERRRDKQVAELVKNINENGLDEVYNGERMNLDEWEQQYD